MQESKEWEKKLEIAKFLALYLISEDRKNGESAT